MTRFAHYTPVLALLVVSLIFIATLNSSAQKAGDRRPRIGLVLSGGGARGLAHVGVIKVLEEYGIHVDYIVGTSMGSLVGGLYASGYDAVELEKTALSIDWGRYLDDRVSRRELSYDEKQDDGRFIISLPVKKGEGPKLQGIIEGIKLHAFLNRLLFHVRGTADFNELPVPFACVATDIYTGRAVILNKGHLPTALRASMAIPSIFTPVEIDGRFLVDGGLVLNFPVSVAKEMGADIIIGVDVGTPLYKEGDSLSIPEIIDQISSFRGAESTENQRRLCDILITPELEGFNSSDFDKTPELIAQGEKAARLHAEELKALAEQQNAYREEPKIIKVDKTPDKIFIKKIRFEGLKNVSKQMIKNRLQLEVPSYVTIDDIEK
ncbi:MAG TPA: patatin-like phospholipase family protein, partial [Spirochaetota bacterium]|nr:patatin-like phospholipase family protein [Spirochaetota bacterium]